MFGSADTFDIVNEDDEFILEFYMFGTSYELKREVDIYNAGTNNVFLTWHVEGLPPGLNLTIEYNRETVPEYHVEWAEGEVEKIPPNIPRLLVIKLTDNGETEPGEYEFNLIFEEVE